MISRWKTNDERRNLIFFLLAAIIACIILKTLITLFQLPFPNKLKSDQNIKFIQIHDNHVPIIVPDSDFISSIRNLSKYQYQIYHEVCQNSDVLRPLTHICKNYTQLSETFLSYLAIDHLLKKNISADNYYVANDINKNILIKHLQSLTIKDKIGIEIGRISDFVIAPLISAYYVTKNEIYLHPVISICNEILSLLEPNKPIPAPFIGFNIKQQHLGKAEVFIDDVSSLFPVLASVAYITKDQKYFDPVQTFVNHIRKTIFNLIKEKMKGSNIQYDESNIEIPDNEKFSIPVKYSLKKHQAGILTSYFDFPYRLFTDLNRISRILPSIKTNDIIQVGIKRLNKENPTVIYDENYVKVISIEPCWFSSMIPTNDPMYSLLVKKCKSMIKRKPTPSRMNGNSEFGGYGLLNNFEFDGEILEILWKNNNIDEAKKLILGAIKECTYGDGFITGLSNTTFEGKRSDNFLHPQFFSRWILNAALIETGIKYDDVVLSDNGNILKI